MKIVNELTSVHLLEFSDSDYSGMAYKYKGPNINTFDENKRIAMSLPQDYCIQIINEGGFSIINKIHGSLAQYINDKYILGNFIHELTLAIKSLASVISIDFNLASLRIVDEKYIEKEHPSVSNLYHRDSSSLTLTKTFYGEGALYLDESNVNREFFVDNSIATHDSLAMIDPKKFEVVGDGMWLLLKGEMGESIDPRNKEFVAHIRGGHTDYQDMFLGQGLIHRGGRFVDTPIRLVFTFSSYTTKRPYQ
ncbi:hypothetical protein IMQ36_08810 [Providencia rettgeri]|nr:hypothetical protein [Providencia rettgeri]QPE19168.1 hypothetical protein IMQ36_08810 [Providencia rettgeri]